MMLFVSLVAASVAAPVVSVSLYQPRDFEFRSSAVWENPFVVRFEARVSGPDGRSMLIPGFHDGDGVWKIRFSPTAIGEWSLVTSSDDPQLDGKTVSGIRCVAQTNPKIAGGLRIDPKHPRHFIREDGSRFYLMGYECDWLWALDTTNPELPTVNAFLDKLAAHGFNYIITNVYAHDTQWRPGHSEPLDYGPPPVYPWLGSNEKPDHSGLNPGFWRHYDRVIEAMYSRGIVAHIMTKVYNKMVNWPKPMSPEEDLYYRTLIARYSAYPNVVWDFSKEAHIEANHDYKVRRLKWIREHDPYKRLMTVHDDSAAYDRGGYDGVLAYRSDQQHEKWHETILAQRAMREWPVVNVEFGYEWGPKGEEDYTFGARQSPEEVIRRAWEICAAGGYCAYYYTHTAWDVIHPEHTPPGYAHMKRLREFWESTRYWLMEPHDELVSRGWCIANPGEEYVVVARGREEFTLRVEGAARSLQAEWFNPFTGDRRPAGSVGNGRHSFRPPAEWNTPVSTLHLTRLGAPVR